MRPVLAVSILYTQVMSHLSAMVGLTWRVLPWLYLPTWLLRSSFFFFQAEDGIRDDLVTGVQTCALPICALVVGSPDEVVEKILFQHELFGHQRFMAQMSVGNLPHAEVLRSIELLGTQVDRKSVV